jgi:hypothetical protein
MFIIRWLSVVLIVISLMLLGADVVNTLEKHGELVIRSLEMIIMIFGYDAKSAIQGNIPPQLANVLLSIIAWPGWLTIGGLGVLLALIAPQPRTARRSAPPVPPISR